MMAPVFASRITFPTAHGHTEAVLNGALFSFIKHDMEPGCAILLWARFAAVVMTIHIKTDLLKVSPLVMAVIFFSAPVLYHVARFVSWYKVSARHHEVVCGLGKHIYRGQQWNIQKWTSLGGGGGGRGLRNGTPVLIPLKYVVNTVNGFFLKILYGSFCIYNSLAALLHFIRKRNYPILWNGLASFPERHFEGHDG